MLEMTLIRRAQYLLVFVPWCLPVDAAQATQMSDQTAEIIRQTVAKVTALGEYGRSCAAVLNNNQNQLRDVGDKTREIDLRVDGLQVDIAKLNRPKSDPDVVKLDRQRQVLLVRRKELQAEGTALTTDIGAQQKCINDAKTLLSDIIKNPSQPVPAPKKKQDTK